jgi:hypothetical protein
MLAGLSEEKQDIDFYEFKFNEYLWSGVVDEYILHPNNDVTVHLISSIVLEYPCLNCVFSQLST